MKKSGILSLKRARQASAVDGSKFTFVVGKKCIKYSCCLFQACLMSQKVCRIVSSDPTCGSLRVAPNQDCDEFAILSNFWNGEEICVNKENALALLKLSKELEIDDLCDLLADFDPSTEKLSLENAVPRLHLKSSLGLAIHEEIEFIASNFFQISRSHLENLTLDEFEMIIGHRLLSLDSESAFLDLILGLMQTDSSYSTLLNYVYFEYLDVDHAEKFLKVIYPNFVNQIRWDSMTDFILKRMRNEPIRGKRLVKEKLFVYNKVNPMNGIISWIRDDCGGNPHEMGVINITASSTRGETPPHMVVTHGHAGQWGSDYRYAKEWIQFDFKGALCKLKGYSVKPGHASYAPKRWVIECSNDGLSWRTVDSRYTEDLVCGSYTPRYFSCNQSSDAFFRYIRMTNTGPNRAGDYELRLSEIEFFGTLQPKIN